MKKMMMMMMMMMMMILIISCAYNPKIKTKDQMSTSSCAAVSISSMVDYELSRKYGKEIETSPMFLYFNARCLSNTQTKDVGCQLESCLLAIMEFGVCLESEYPFNVVNINKSPSKELYDKASKHKSIKIKRLDDFKDMKDSIDNHHLFVVGIVVTNDMFNEQAKNTGKLVSPMPYEFKIGYHALLIIGYSEEKHMFIGKNSYGDSWGDNGKIYIPYSFMQKYSADSAWSITEME